MDELTPQPIQPAYNPGEAHHNDPRPGGKKPRPKPEPDPPQVEAPEDLIDIDDDQDEHSVDTFAASGGESLSAYLRSLAASLRAWKELETAVSQSCESIVRMDLDSIDEQTSNQERLCRMIRRLEDEQTRLIKALDSDAADLGERVDIVQLRESIEAWQVKVRTTNRVQERLTAHSHQLVKRISNALVRFFTTYPEPHAGGSTPGR